MDKQFQFAFEAGAAFKHAYEQFRVRCDSRNLSPSTLAWYKQILTGLERFLARRCEVLHMDRIEPGHLRAGVEAAGARAAAWETPHYQASPRASRVFARRFDWSVGRAVYFPAGAPESLLPTGQFYPYEIFGDLYGQRLVPENVGNAQPYLNEQVLKSVTVDDMIRIMRRNAVLRDAWASFFVHPSMLDTAAFGGTAARPGDAGELERLVRAAREHGYEFVSLSDWTRRNLRPIRPEPVEVMP